ncbi:symmetrical bis(5'-nucleosyl)-tetraphosphatase [Buchnera aphidicola]|uniref:bis(5'-nucleosyl)-tetraphosphatase (symmetrical) n=1 Tax=Buchnera aphidicola (Stegophylla sp.) TaxID=2315800 RepID=A0A4D6YK24_9GAMM|nr:symmetrical bis(5'-nucleosyl)-tetraphosphatase [Buchnera aphidicola (Stegophylla sp.)]QCI26284.1 symmetrical bis(5'-nucleosyl)-tetraphosphatase [Buchnera aphidicola (Stegophylla sp.)]
MSIYLTSDIHGCYNKLQVLLKKISFNPDYDSLWVAGDLVSRGQQSLEVLRFLKSLGTRVKIVLGNHDIRAILIYFGIKNFDKNDNLKVLFESHDSDVLIDWLRKQPLFIVDKKQKIIMVHAGVYPLWDINTVQNYSNIIEYYLSSENYIDFLKKIKHTSSCCLWKENMSYLEQIKFSINIFTRMRYCYLNKLLDMRYKCSPNELYNKTCLKPWFTFKNLIPKKYSIFFGHWASLPKKIISYNNNIISLDTGCCWGRELSIIRWNDKMWFRS